MRGIACLLVMYGHVVLLGIGSSPTVTTFFPMIQNAPIEDIGEAAQILKAPEIYGSKIGIRLGQLGVSLFFLISGFVIVKSLETLGAGAFAVGRVFRIMPLCMVVTVLVSCSVSLADFLYGFDSPNTVGSTLASALLLPGWLHTFYALPVIWSLIVEMCFYATLAITFALTRKIASWHLLLISILLLGFVALIIGHVAILTHNLGWIYALQHSAYNACFVIYILVGSAIYKAVQSEKEFLGNMACSVLILAIFRWTLKAYEQTSPGLTGFSIYNAYWAFVIFVTALAFNRFVKPSRIGAFLADISFPLYLVHVPLAWVYEYVLSQKGVPPLAALGVAAAVSLGTAWLLHIYVERPSHRLGIALSKRIRKDTGALTNSRPGRE